MVNQAFRIKIAYRSKEKKNTRDRSVPDGSDKKLSYWYEFMRFQKSKELIPKHEISGCSRYFDIGNLSDSYTTPSSAEKVIPKPTKPCVIS